MWEGKCTNEDCQAQGTWVLDFDNDGRCNTCLQAFIEYVKAPLQKFADPNKQPDPAMRNMGG